MATTATFTRPKSNSVFRAEDATTESWAVRGLLISTAGLFLGIFLFLPLAVVFTAAFAKGVSLYLASLREPDALAAIRLTLLTAAIAVPLNLVFGVAAAWSIGKFEFLGKSLLITLIDLPFSVSPVVAGLIYVLCFGLQGLLGPWLAAHNHQDHLCRPRHRFGNHFCDLSFCRARNDPLVPGTGE